MRDVIDETLREVLEDPTRPTKVRAAAAAGLGQIGRDASSASVAALSSRLDDQKEETEVRIAAAQALAECGGVGVPALVAALAARGNDELAAVSAVALGRLGKTATVSRGGENKLRRWLGSSALQEGPLRIGVKWQLAMGALLLVGIVALILYR